MVSENSVQRILLEKISGIDGVTELAKRIRDALASSNVIEFDLSEVTELELPAIQVLYAAALSAAAAGGGASLAGSIQESVAVRLLVTGFSKTIVRDGQALQSRMPGFATPGGCS
ncbi:MAG: STAS domain-containing protein [Spirochaetota bacterium]